MNTKARLKKLERALFRDSGNITCVGFMDENDNPDPQSAIDYEKYLRSGARKPFIWFTSGMSGPEYSVRE